MTNQFGQNNDRLPATGATLLLKKLVNIINLRHIILSYSDDVKPTANPTEVTKLSTHSTESSKSSANFTDDSKPSSTLPNIEDSNQNEEDLNHIEITLTLTLTSKCYIPT